MQNGGLASVFPFIRSNPGFLGFGFLMAFVSSGGQTYLIGVFGPEIQAAFSLSHTQWGSYYMIGTLSSSLLLLWSGKLIDSIDLRIYTVFVVLGMAAACLAMGFADSVVGVIGAIFLLRHFGQGLSSHTSVTSMARYFGPDRGKAIALSSMGFSLGEGVLPVLVVTTIALFGWRQSYMVVALATLLLLPGLLLLLAGHGKRHQEYLAEMDSRADRSKEPGDQAHKTRKQVLWEWRFWLIMFGTLSSSLILTAMFFHHLNLAQAKGWSGTWVTGNYGVYAVATVITSFAVGPLVDRLTAVRVMPLYMLPLAVAFVSLIYGESPYWVLPYMLLMGVTTGLYYTGTPALLTELYGTRHLGAIKSMVGSLGVFATALGPVLVGILLDTGLGMDDICLVFVLMCLVSTVLMVYALHPGMLPGRRE